MLRNMKKMKHNIFTSIILILTLIISTLAGAEAPVLTIDSVEGGLSNEVHDFNLDRDNRH